VCKTTGKPLPVATHHGQVVDRQELHIGAAPSALAQEELDEVFVPWSEARKCQTVT
jgi:hypothetical protein